MFFKKTASKVGFYKVVFEKVKFLKTTIGVNRAEVEFESKIFQFFAKNDFEKADFRSIFFKKQEIANILI